jgi:ribosomal protein L16 Arg81 hydroxylase
VYTVQNFADFIAPVSTGVFLERYWQQAPLHLRRQQPDCYGGLLSPEDIDRVISAGDNRHYFVRQSRSQAANTDTRSEIPWDNGVFSRAHTAFATGHTIAVAWTDRKLPGLDRLYKDMEAHFGACVTGTIFLTPGGGHTGFATHSDCEETFAIQLRGTKRWRIWKAQYELPIPHLKDPPIDCEALGEPVLDVVLHPGDLVYIPRGWIHNVEGTEQTSFHLSVAVEDCTWAELMLEALYVAIAEDTRMRAGLPGNLFEMAPEQLQAHFGELMARAAQTDLELPVRRLRSNILKKMFPPLDGHFARVLEVDSLTLQTPLRKRPGMVSQLWVDEASNQVLLQFPGNQVVAPREMEEALRFLRASDIFRPADLPLGGPADHRLPLCQRLVVEGFLTPASISSSSLVN